MLVLAAALLAAVLGPAIRKKRELVFAENA